MNQSHLGKCGPSSLCYKDSVRYMDTKNDETIQVKVHMGTGHVALFN